MRVEILTDPNMMSRGARMIEALIQTCPLPITPSVRYTGTADLLVTYGTGHPLRRQWWNRHRASGRHCIGLDLGYWGADTMRVTIDADHPQAWIRPEHPGRWDTEGIELRNDFNPKGPAIIVGMGRKSLAVHHLRLLEWENRAVCQAKALGLVPVLKPKRLKYATIPGVSVETRSIEEALKGASLVICRHSNVAIDACIAGIPVKCEDGAAFALYGKIQNPDYDQRLEFLRSLAWWNYRIDEAALAWKYLLSRLCV